MIVVTTPTGQIGQHVVRGLIAAKVPLRVIVRDASKLSADVRRAVDVVEGSHGDGHVIDAALVGAQGLFWVAPTAPAKTMEQIYVEFARPAVAAIKRNHVKRVVSVTALGRGTRWQEASGLVTASIEMDDLLMSAGASFRGLAMPSFMDNMLRQATSIRERGMFSGPIDPDLKLPTTAVGDLSSLAVRLLVDNGWSGQQEIPVIGPEDLSHNEMAAILSDVVGRQVHYQQVSFQQVKQQFLSRGASESFAEGYVDMFKAKNDGMDAAAAQNVLNRTATAFRNWCEGQLRASVTV